MPASCSKAFDFRSHPASALVFGLAACASVVLTGCQVGQVLVSGATKLVRATTPRSSPVARPSGSVPVAVALPSPTTLAELVEPDWGEDWVQTIAVLRQYLASGGPEASHARRRLYDALIAYGELLVELGQREDAIETWRQASQVDDSRPGAPDLIAKLSGATSPALPVPSASSPVPPTPSPGRTPSRTPSPSPAHTATPASVMSPTPTPDNVSIAQAHARATQTQVAVLVAPANPRTMSAMRATGTAGAAVRRADETRQASTVVAQATGSARERQQAVASATASSAEARDAYFAQASAQLTLTAVASEKSAVALPNPTPVPPPTSVPPTSVPPTTTSQPSPTAVLQGVERRIPPQDAQLSIGTSVTFAWNRSPGAAKYRLQLWQLDYTSDLEYDIVVEGVEHSLIIPDKQGPWMWRVIAVSSDGRLGPISKNQNRFLIQ